MNSLKWYKGIEGKWHWFDLVFVMIRTSWYILALRDLFANPEELPNDKNPFITVGQFWIIALWLTICFFLPLFFYFSKKLRPISPIAELVLLGTLLLYLASEPSAFYLYNLPVFTIGYFCFRRVYGWLYIPTVIIVPFFAGIMYDYLFEVISSKIMDNTIMFLIGVCFRTMITSHDKMNEMMKVIQEQNHTLEVYSKQIERLTIIEERNRLASELHDTVGHTFTSTILGMEAVYHQMDQNPAEAKGYLKQLAHFARDGYSDVRRHIHQIAVHEEESPLVGTLGEICHEFEQHTGTMVKLHVSGEATEQNPINETVKLSLIRFLQESLTNAKRHGQASEITVELSISSLSVIMSVMDNGVGNENLKFGFGLSSMEKRLKSLQGSLVIDSEVNRGTKLTCEIPVKAG